MPFRFLFRRSPARGAVEDAYRVVVARARLPVFYAECGVPDTVDGRFEMVALHVFLVLNRLKAAQDHEEEGSGAAKAFGQSLFDLMFADMDQALREMGVGDLSVGREVKRMAKAFYGRASAYEAGLLAEGGGVLEDALRRNLYGTAAPGPAEVARVAAYIRSAAAFLGGTPVAEIAAGRFGFPAMV